MKGLAPHTASIFEAISRLDCIKPYVLVGGTALSLQIATRQSEDLDFMSWKRTRNEKREVDWPLIKKELKTVGNVEKCDILDFDHVEFIVNGVKLSFYASPNRSPLKSVVHCLNNIVLADKTSIGAMKLEVMLRRSKFRDYYDIYSLIEAGEDIHEMISMAINYSGHKLKTKNILALLTRSDRFVPDDGFRSLNPIYDITPIEIEKRIIQAVKPE
ncbi:nucleotidyl transferase AbiEii/AbiGii toxin family protein [Duncaniella dubosii]|uniref:nucleotidyl transferase AbiEii/AbiGii toxin family protein n=1 Tax=Duncaniella dubosii TaxID=2518971 RepID=UPI0032B19702